MGLFSVAERDTRLSPRRRSAYGAGERIYHAGSDGLAWRLHCGVVRLDTAEPAGSARFASLAIAGDILGCETMLFGNYAFTATALTNCDLRPWPEGEGVSVGDSLLSSLAKAQNRAADIVALRGGQAADRVLGLIKLLTDGADRVVLPTRQDIADITDLRFETISRIIKSLERTRALLPIKIEGVHATRSYAVNFAAL
ncbi:MAG: Crp/Fnr family transcriptional regulator [Azonexus sp.]|nr:Crp/Fnr family transcriptional regulator [Azonexus sp.]